MLLGQKAGLSVATLKEDAPFPRPVQIQQAHPAAERVRDQRQLALTAQAHAQRPFRQVPFQFSLGKGQLHQAVGGAEQRADPVRADAQRARLTRQALDFPGPATHTAVSSSSPSTAHRSTTPSRQKSAPKQGLLG